MVHTRLGECLALIRQTWYRIWRTMGFSGDVMIVRCKSSSTTSSPHIPCERSGLFHVPIPKPNEDSRRMCSSRYSLRTKGGELGEASAHSSTKNLATNLQTLTQRPQVNASRRKELVHGDVTTLRRYWHTQRPQVSASQCTKLAHHN